MGEAALIRTRIGRQIPANVSAYSEPDIAKDKLVAHFEREYLQRLVLRAGSNMSKAARLANIDRTTLYRLMEKHGMRRDELADASDG